MVGRMSNKINDNWKKFITKTILESDDKSGKIDSIIATMKQNYYKVRFSVEYPGKETASISPIFIQIVSEEGEVIGEFTFMPVKLEGCIPVMVPNFTDATVSGTYHEGLAPLAYDLALEYATKRGMAFASDRETISTQGLGIWQVYKNQRKDVLKKFMPNCPSPKIFNEKGEEVDLEDKDNPCKYFYKKKGNLLARLKAEGLIDRPRRNDLMENLLKEGMKDVSDLPEGIGIEVGYKEDKWISAYYIYLDTDKMVHKSDKENPHGYAFAEKASNSSLNLGPCANAYVISSTEAQQGWGPLLYDIIMEIATSKAGGLTSDRIEVSSDANRIWKKYTKREDVDSMNLDNPNNEMTPPTIDNCVQISTTAHNKDWWDTPLSKVYRKPIADKLTELISSGKIRFVEKLRWKSEMNPSYLPGEL